MYLIKTKGTSKIPDYVQVRDDSFTLIHHFKCGKPEKALRAMGIENRVGEINQIVENAKYGELVSFDI